MESSVEEYVEGDFVAVRSTLYKEKPLIGQVTKTGRAEIQIDWYMGLTVGMEATEGKGRRKDCHVHGDY